MGISDIRYGSVVPASSAKRALCSRWYKPVTRFHRGILANQALGAWLTDNPQCHRAIGFHSQHEPSLGRIGDAPTALGAGAILKIDDITACLAGE